MSSNTQSGTMSVRPRSPVGGRAAARYLFAISASSDEGDWTTTGDLGSSLGVAPASATEMLAKLDERGLVEHEKYRGVRLTNRGETVASRVAWRVCAVTSFFDAVLDADIDDRTAVDIGMTLPRAAIFRLQELTTAPCLDLCPESSREHDGCAA